MPDSSTERPGGGRSNCDLINCFALVAYIPDPLGTILDRMRGRLEPGVATPRAHVTVLPPRPIPPTADAGQVTDGLRAVLAAHAPFEMETGDIGIFPVTNVVYVSLRTGLDALYRLHDELNSGALSFEEPFPYHPHITLAQGLEEPEAQEIAELARLHWREAHAPGRFQVGGFTFVQCTASNEWVDLAECSLAGLAARRG